MHRLQSASIIPDSQRSIDQSFRQMASSSRKAGGAPPATYRFPPPPLPLPFAAPPPMFAYPAPIPFLAPIPYPLPQPPHHAPVPYYGTAAHLPPPVAAPSVEIRSVTAEHFEEELDRIGSLLPMFPIIVIDTEYPGAVHSPPAGQRESQLTADERYALVKANVDDLHVVQLGITLCDERGNLPRAGGLDAAGRPMEHAWEFLFSDFDVHANPHEPASVRFLEDQGLDFDLSPMTGVSSAAFKDKLLAILPEAQRGELTWAAFGGAYDFGYLLKMLSDGQPLPETREEFVFQVRELLGGRVFDVKHLSDNCGRGDLRGVGLRGVADNLGIPGHIPEPPRLAGLKSLTACRIFTAIKRQGLYGAGGACHEGIIDGFL